MLRGVETACKKSEGDLHIYTSTSEGKVTTRGPLHIFAEKRNEDMVESRVFNERRTWSFSRRQRGRILSPAAQSDWFPVTSECLSSRVEQRNHHGFGNPRTGDKKVLYNGAIRGIERSLLEMFCVCLSISFWCSMVDNVENENHQILDKTGWYPGTEPKLWYYRDKKKNSNGRCTRRSWGCGTYVQNSSSGA